ncbi:hypothetical protein BDC45DRAFT_537658 [Circinella umbellata]|nr:hypothetical protein BDC45DRAFT_537658 [Circinella umbellata]
MTDGTYFYAEQIEGQRPFAKAATRRFRHRIFQDDRKCCAWSNKQCNNVESDRNYSVGFLLSIFKRGGPHEHEFRTACPAGGYIVATGTFEKPKYEVYDLNNTVIYHYL